MLTRAHYTYSIKKIRESFHRPYDEILAELGMGKRQLARLSLFEKQQIVEDNLTCLKGYEPASSATVQRLKDALTPFQRREAHAQG